MRVDEVIKSDNVTISFEVFPPKNEVKANDIGMIYEICKLKPSFISCTFRSGGESKETSACIEKTIEELGVPSVAHITSGAFKYFEVDKYIRELKFNKVENLMVLRGDNVSKTDYLHPTDLVKELRQNNIEMCIGGACYPEGHCESESFKEDIEIMKYKQEVGFDYFVSQLFFDNNSYYSFLNRVYNGGVSIPVVPGIMPITSEKQMSHIKNLPGISIPRDLKVIVDKFGKDDSSMKQSGIAYATSQIVGLIANGVKHIHIYSMNKIDVVEQIMKNIDSLIQ